MTFSVPYTNLAKETRPLEDALLVAFRRVLRSGRYLLGPELAAFESEFAQYCGVKYFLRDNRVEAIVHYRTLIPEQPAAATISSGQSYPRARPYADSVLSLPIYPDMPAADQDTVVGLIERFSGA
ncbi:MAG: DegT/DnrJ/EryC1/StrS family aminotransferase [Woeseiaceae bacterium]